DCDPRRWIGTSQVEEDVLTASTVALAHAMLDRPGESPREGDALPLAWHWFFFRPSARQRELGPDGHPRGGQGGGFQPPADLPRRMWASGRLDVRERLRI